MIFTDFLKALAQLPDPRFRRVLWTGILLTIALLVGVYALFFQVTQTFTADGISVPILGPISWLGDLFSWASLGVLIVFSMFLMIPVASAITSMFLDDVAQAVEDKHYPTLPPVGRVPLSEAFRDTINFFGVLVGANILALFAYVAFVWLPIMWPIIFYALNGYLLGREYFQIAAMRRIGRTAAKAMRKRHTREIWLAGILMTLPLTIPVMNLIVPILGAATFTHIFHRLNRH